VGQTFSLRSDPRDPRFHARTFSSGRAVVAGEELDPVTKHGPLTDEASDDHSYFDKNTTALWNTALATEGKEDEFVG
jgi:hypothetical protein